MLSRLEFIVGNYNPKMGVNVKSITKLGTLVFCACTGLLFLASATQGLSCYHCSFNQNVGEECECRLNPSQDKTKCEFIKFPNPDATTKRPKNKREKDPQKPRQDVVLCSINVKINDRYVDLLRYSEIWYPENLDVNITSKCNLHTTDDRTERVCYCNTDWCNGQPFDFPDFWAKPTTTTRLPCPSTTTTMPTTTRKSSTTTSTPGTSTTPCAPNPPTKQTTPQSVTSSSRAFNHPDDYFTMHKYWILCRTTILLIGSLLLHSGVGHV